MGESKDTYHMSEYPELICERGEKMGEAVQDTTLFDKNTENIILECIHELISLHKLAGAGDSQVAIQQSIAIRNALNLLPDYCDNCGSKLNRNNLYCMNCTAINPLTDF